MAAVVSCFADTGNAHAIRLRGNYALLSCRYPHINLDEFLDKFFITRISSRTSTPNVHMAHFLFTTPAIIMKSAAQSVL